MEFCPECETVLRPQMVEGKKMLVCLACNFKKTTEANADDFSPINREKSNKETVIIENEPDSMAKMRERCPKCEHNEAYYWQLQTRSADEPATTFKRCTKCKHTWREY